MPHPRLYPLTVALAAGLWPIALPAGSAFADKAPRVGIAVSVQVNLDRSEAQELSAALGRALHDKLVVDVIAGADAARRLPAAGISESCAVDEACIKETAQRLSADELLFLVAVKVGNRIQVDSTWVDPATGRSASRPKVVMVKLEEAEARFADSASLILPDAAVRSLPGTDAGSEMRGPILVRTTRRHMTPGAWVAAGVGVAAVGAFAGFGLATRSKWNDCADKRDTPAPCSDSEIDAVSRNGITADISLGVAAVSAAVFGVLLYTSGGDIERVPVGARALRLDVGPSGGAVLSLEGRL